MASLLLLSTTPATTSREQAIENYKALLKKKKDINRKNKAIQTKIGHFLRKNNIDLAGSVTNLSNLNSEEEATLYGELFDKLKGITEDLVRETTEFDEEGSEIESSRKKTERQINLVEEQFKDIKTKITKNARDSQTNKPIPSELLLTIAKIEKEKELELRKLMLTKFREHNRLMQVERAHREDFMFSSSNAPLSSQLAMENALCQAEIDRAVERDIDVRQRIVESIVMMSHIGMKFHFLKEGINKLEAQNDVLKKTMNVRKEQLRNVKADEEKLSTEKANLEDKAVLLSNMKLLRDYKQTSQLLQAEMDNNTKLRKVLGHWWEGLQSKIP
jgi:cell division protein FtsB